MSSLTINGTTTVTTATNTLNIGVVSGQRIGVITVTGPRGLPGAAGTGSAGAAGVNSLNGLSGSLNLIGTGGVIISSNGQNIIVSGAGLSNPSGYVLQSTQVNSHALTGDVTVRSSDIPVDFLPGSSYSNLQQFINTMHSPGLIQGAFMTDGGGGILNISPGTGMLRVADDNISSLAFVGIPSTGLSVPMDVQQYYAGFSYNAGNPVFQLRSTNNWDNDTEIALGTVVNFFGTLVISNNPFLVGDPITNIIQRFDAMSPITRDAIVGGLILGEVPTRKIVVSAGKLWTRLNDFVVPALNTSASTTMYSAYYNGAFWVYTTAVTQWDNLYWNNVAAGLQSVDVGYYANLWFYLTVESNSLGFIYGQAQYGDLTSATNEGAPSFLPNNFTNGSILLGRLTFYNGATTASQISSAFNTVFTTVPVTTHNNLAGLQGGASNEFYHLSNNDYSTLTGFAGNTGRYLTTGQADTRYVRLAGNQTVSGVKYFKGLSALNLDLDKTTTAGTGVINQNGSPLLHTYSYITSQNNVFLGEDAGNFSFTGDFNIGVGGLSLQNLINGSNNVGIGGAALYLTNFGGKNTAIGHQSLAKIGQVSASDLNTAIGYQALYNLETGQNNIGIGWGAGFQRSGNNNISIGRDSGPNALVENDLAIGHYAGKYSTGSNEVWIDNLDRTNISRATNESLIFGQLNDNPYLQTLRINANSSFPYGLSGDSIRGQTITGIQGLYSGNTNISNLFYPRTNPSGYLTGFDSGLYATAANLALTGNQAWTAANGNGVNLSGNLSATGAALIARDLTISGVVSTTITSSGSALFGLMTGMSGQGVTDYATKANLASTGQQAWTAANTNAVIISGNLTQTGVALVARDLAISGVIDTRFSATGALLSAVKISGSSIIPVANFTGIGSVAVVYSGSTIFISGAASSAGSNADGVNLSGNLTQTGVQLGNKISLVSGWTNSTFVHLTGDEFVSGSKTFLGQAIFKSPLVSDAAIKIDGSNGLGIDVSGAAISAGSYFISAPSTPLLEETAIFNDGNTNIESALGGIIFSIIGGNPGDLGPDHRFAFLGGPVGLGTLQPTAFLHNTGTVRFEYLKSGYLAADGSGNLFTTGVSGFATISQLTGLSGWSVGMSGALQAQLAASAAGVTQVNGLSGSLTIFGTGNFFVSTGVPRNIIISGSGLALSTELTQSGVLLGANAQANAINLSGSLTQTGATLVSLIANSSGLFVQTGGFLAYLTGVTTGSDNQWIGFNYTFPSIPKVTASFEIYSGNSFGYFFSVSGRSTSGFYAQYSDIVLETGNQLDVFAKI